MKNKILEFIKKHKLVFIAIIITILVEIFLCNYTFFRTIIVGNTNIKAGYTIVDKNIKISNINSRVTSIYFEYDNKLTDKITYNLSYKTEGTSDIININSKVLLPNDEHYIKFDTHSKCSQIEINLLTESDVKLKNIILNYPILDINFIRMIGIFLIVIFFLKVQNGSIYNQNYDPNSKKQNMVFIINLTTACLFIFLYACLEFNTNVFFIDKNNINKEDSILMQTESIINGQIKLMEEPSKELKEMKNPYDSIVRDETVVPYLYDVAYYNGSYYNYFGIAPILTSILPFRIITGRYTHTYLFNMIYIFIAVISLYFLYKKLVKKYIEKISLCNFYLGFYAILFASNIFTLLRGQKYDIVISSACAFLLLSLNLALSIYENNKFKYLKLILLGITTALIVLSKPNFIVYYLLILFLIILSMKEKTLKEKIKDSIFILVPLVIFAIFQMILNYVRFDNILEFGAKYQLTGFNMQYCMMITFGKFLVGIFEYIFKLPIIRPFKFPFIFVNTDTALTTINEVCYENRLIGLAGIPIMYAYLMKSNFVEKTKNKELNSFLNCILITSFLSIILNTCFGGICEAYCIDFKLILSIGAVIILLKGINKSKEKKDANKIFLILCVLTLLIMTPISLTTESNFLVNLTNNTTVYLKNLFEFWA